ncbi:hypothetical protein [Kitasatospora sp. NPDC004531]
MNAVRERLAALCDQITRHHDMRQFIDEAGAGPQLAQLLDAVTAEQPPDRRHLLDLLNAIEKACGRQGLVGITTASKQYTPLPTGFAEPAPDEPLTWICPLRRCNRAVFEDEATEPPSCAAAGRPMDAIRVL